MKITVSTFGNASFDVDVGKTTPEQQLERRVDTLQGLMADYPFIYGTSGKLGGAQTGVTVTPVEKDPVQEAYREASAFLCSDPLSYFG